MFRYVDVAVSVSGVPYVPDVEVTVTVGMATFTVTLTEPVSEL